MSIERYIGGGKVYFTPYDGTNYTTEFEIGEVQEGKVSVSNSYVDAYSKDSGMDKKVDKVLSKTEGKISFTTQNLSSENVAMAMFGTSSTETFASGEDLPDGTTATSSITIPVTEAGTLPKIVGRVRIVGVNNTGTKNPVLIADMVSLTPSGDIRDYFNNADYSKLAFEGEVIETNGKYFREYLMDKS